MAKKHPSKEDGARAERSIRISAAMQKRVRLYAAQADTTMAAVVEEALADYLKRRGA